MDVYKKVIRTYIAISIMVINVLVLFVTVNLVALGYLKIKHSWVTSNPVSEKYKVDTQIVYPELSNLERKQLLQEIWGKQRKLQYEPFCQFKESPFSGKYVNISPHGFRHSANQGPWPPDEKRVNIFVFGGSTTFGYGLADEHTVPSYLQEVLEKKYPLKSVAVYNFGRAYFYSSQERALFEKLIIEGIVPDIALFIDGLNDLYNTTDEPYFTPQLQGFMPVNKKFVLKKIVARLPAVRLFSNLQVGVISPKFANLDEGAIDKMISRYYINQQMIRAISKTAGIKPVFVWQPVPFYKFDPKHHPFQDDTLKLRTTVNSGYKKIALKYQNSPVLDDFIWCADLQQEIHEVLYVDGVHYGSKLARLLAECIASYLPTY